MNIALVCDYSLDYLGGAQTAFLEQARALADAGHHVVVIAPRGIRRVGIESVRHEWIDALCTIPGVGLPLIRNTRALRGRIIRILARERVDIVHIHSEFGLAAACIDAADDIRVPVVHTVHTFFWRSGMPRSLNRVAASAIALFHSWLTGHGMAAGGPPGSPTDVALLRMTRSTALRAAIVISPSEHQRQRLLAAGIRAVVTEVNTTVPGSGIRPGPLRRIDGPLRVLWIGRCAPEKRLLPFLSACVSALVNLPPGSLNVMVLGEGPDLARARRIARGRPEIVFRGRVDADIVQHELADAHLAALTSSGFDNQPMTVVEALYAARGVLYVDPALVEGLDTAGILCSGDHAQSIAATLIALVRDSDAVVRASARAHAAFERFTPTRFVADVEAVYRHIQAPVPAARVVRRYAGVLPPA